MNRNLLLVLLVAGVVLLIAAIVLVFTLVPGGFGAFFSRPAPTPTLPPLPALDVTPPSSLVELADEYPELADILTDPELDSAYKQFLLAYQTGGEEAAMELARQRGLLTPEGDIRVTLVLDTEDHAPLVAQLEQIGVRVVSAYQDRVNVAVPMALVEAQLEREEPGAIFEQLTELEHVIAVRLPEQRVPDRSDVDGEGVEIVGANTWHQAGFTGQGLRVGILDLGFAGHQSLLGTELPEQVPMQQFGWVDEEEVHGTACAEIVHEIAPEADLFFAWYDGSDAAMGEAVDWLRSQGVTIISHSVGSLTGPRDGSEWEARFVDDLAAQGLVWVNSAGNQGLGHYRGAFTDQDGDGIHEFMPGEELLPLPNNGYVEVFLMWEDWTVVDRDYDLFLYDGSGNELASSQNVQSGQAGQEPVEGVWAETGGEMLYALVKAYEGSQSLMIDIFVWPIDLPAPYAVPAYSICPPSDAVGSLTVGAVNYWDDSLAEYSSQGPATDGRLKPDIAAPAGVSGATYGPDGFPGTSASCPHVAGAAALVWQAHPEFSRQQVVDYLLSNALDLGAPGLDTGFGYGRLQLPPPGSISAPPADATLPPPPTVDPAAPPAPLPSPTGVAYATPVPGAPGAGGAGAMALGLIVLVGGVGCLGGALLLVGGVGLILIVRRSRRAPAPPRPIPRPPAPQVGRCPKCGAAVQPGARFCSACRQPLGQQPAQEPRCRYCGAALSPEARFCNSCGRTTE